MAEAEMRSSSNKNTGTGRRFESVDGTTSDSEVLMKQIMYGITLLEPAKEEIRQLYARTAKNKDTDELKSNSHETEKETETLKEQLKELRKLQSNTSDELYRAKAQIAEFEDAWKNKEYEVVQTHKEEVYAYKDVIKKTEELLQAEKNGNNKLKELAKSKIEELDREKSKLSEVFEEIKREKANVENELSETKSRLSKLMGDKISDNNPDIADLSDKNRPTKIAEKYTELYDNQWTDAYEAAEKHFLDARENDRIKVLKKLLLDIYEFCKQEYLGQDKELVKVLCITEVTGQRRIPDTIKKQMKDIKRQTAPYGFDDITKKFLANADKGTQTGSFMVKVRDFVHECLSFCWLMVHQDPPLAFDVCLKSGDLFDNNRYKAYTATGTTVDFIVWPPLLLHQHGPVLAKGVAQCMKSFQGSQSVRVRSAKVLEANTGAGSVRLTGKGLDTSLPESQKTPSQVYSKTKKMDTLDQKTPVVPTGSPNDSTYNVHQGKGYTQADQYAGAVVNQQQRNDESAIQYQNNFTHEQQPKNLQFGQETQFRSQAYVQLIPAAGNTPQQQRQQEQRQQNHQHQQNTLTEQVTSSAYRNLQQNYSTGASSPYVNQTGENAPLTNQHQPVTLQQPQMSTRNPQPSQHQQTQLSTYGNPPNNVHGYNVLGYNYPVHLIPTQYDLNTYYTCVNSYGAYATRQILGAAAYDKCKNYHDWRISIQ